MASIKTDSNSEESSSIKSFSNKQGRGHVVGIKKQVIRSLGDRQPTSKSQLLQDRQSRDSDGSQS